MNKEKRILDRKSLTFKEITIVVCVVACIALVIIYGSYRNLVEVKKQTQQNLADVAKQNAVMLKTSIHTEHELLESLSRELTDATPENIQDKLNHYKIFLNNFNLKRFAYSFPDGMTYSTDGDATDLDYREFYKAGMEGRCYITGILTDAIDKKASPVNVITEPVYDEEGNINGVFGLAYDTKKFNNFLQIESFDGDGYSCIIDENYEIIAATENRGLELSQSLIDDILKPDSRNEKTIQNITSQIGKKEEGFGTLYLDGRNYYYSIPVNLMNGDVTWYIFTIIPDYLLKQKAAPIQMNQYSIAFLVLVLVLFGAAMIVLFIKKQHQNILHFAYEDPITEGSTYTKFCAEMEAGDFHHGNLVALDIANFNYISIVAGENATDKMIKEAWNTISSSLQKDELAAHIREQMFILYLTETDTDRLIQRLEHISHEIGNKAKEFHVYGIRAGYGIYPLAEDEAFENAYSKAKIAKEYALTNPESHYAFYSDVNETKIQREKQLEELFPSAIEQEEFEVWYQPKYDAETCRIVGSEALVRWRQQDGQMISPGEFIPLFERNGMIATLDEYMFRAVCRQQKHWLDNGQRVYPVSVNISRASLYCIDVEKHYHNIMKEYNIEPQYVQLEVTESVLDTRKDVCELLNRFRKMGIKILMDDFGTGYSSLATLSTQCFDTLKLDKTLIDHIGSQDGETILSHIIRMGQQMGLHITAEGVEKETQLTFLQKLKCNDIQGFYFARPMPAAEYETIVAN